jgi:hypothetical protein
MAALNPASNHPCLYRKDPSTGILVSRFCQRNTVFLQEKRGFQQNQYLVGPTLVSFFRGRLRGSRERGGQLVDPGRLAQVVIHSSCETFFAITPHGVGGQATMCVCGFE